MTSEADHLTDLPPVLPFVHEAQKLAFAPIAFQVARVLRETGILRAVEQARGAGITTAELVEQLSVSHYGATVLLEAGLGIEVVQRKGERWVISKVGRFILNDRMTRINMDFVHHVCYRGMFKLDEAIATGKPAGLRAFGDWQTLYQALAQLPPQVRESWFNFDHHYSDGAFPEVLPIVFSRQPKSLLDIGGNTGKWSLACLRHDPAVKVTMVDLPGQLQVAQQAIAQAGLAERWSGIAVDLLNRDAALPSGFEVIWMSQFLCCFGEDDIVSILTRVHEAMGPDTTLFVLETYWDQQHNETASYCLQMSSVYFTCMANGNSRMYSSDVMKRCIAAANLEVVDEVERLAPSHTLLTIKRRSS